MSRVWAGRPRRKADKCIPHDFAKQQIPVEDGANDYYFYVEGLRQQITGDDGANDDDYYYNVGGSR